MVGIVFAGATICPLNPGYSQKEFEHTVNISKPKYIFVSRTTLKTAKKFVKNLSWSPILINMQDDSKSSVPSINNLISKISSSEVKNFTVTDVDIDEHIVSILCSSGTTGLPKGVMLSDKNYLSAIQVLSHSMLKKGEALICFLPFFHAYCFTVLLLGLIIGCKCIVFSKFEEKTFLETIEKYRIEYLSLVPPLMIFLAKHPMVDQYDLSSVKTILCGAAPLSKEVEIAVKKTIK